MTGDASAADLADLARRAAGGDRDALDQLWRGQRRFVAAVLLAHAPDPGDVDDLLQEVAASLCARIGELRDPERVRPWLRSIAVNAARDALRRRSVRRADGPAGAAPDLDALPGVAEEGGAADALEHVLALARGLPAEFREPLLLKALRGMSQRAIADALDLTEAAVETRLARARRLLRDELERADTPLPFRRHRETTHGT